MSHHGCKKQQNQQYEHHSSERCNYHHEPHRGFGHRMIHPEPRFMHHGPPSFHHHGRFVRRGNHQHFYHHENGSGHHNHGPPSFHHHGGENEEFQNRGHFVRRGNHQHFHHHESGSGHHNNGPRSHHFGGRRFFENHHEEPECQKIRRHSTSFGETSTNKHHHCHHRKL
jgi:hypothetical protein